MKSDFGHIVMVPKHVCQSSWWATAPRDGFTKLAAGELRVTVPIDLHETEHRAFIQRQHLLSALLAFRKAKKNIALMHANVVGN